MYNTPYMYIHTLQVWWSSMQTWPQKYRGEGRNVQPVGVWVCECDRGCTSIFEPAILLNPKVTTAMHNRTSVLLGSAPPIMLSSIIAPYSLYYKSPPLPLRHNNSIACTVSGEIFLLVGYSPTSLSIVGPTSKT